MGAEYSAPAGGNTEESRADGGVAAPQTGPALYAAAGRAGDEPGGQADAQRGRGLPAGVDAAPWTCRLHGAAAAGRHDVFLSYRWAADGRRSTENGCPTASNAVPVLHAALQAAGVATFWDQECLNLGEPLVGGFTVALAGSKLAVLVVSQPSLNRIRDEASKTTDNVLLGAPRPPALTPGRFLLLDPCPY